jgi:eukaryotic-like serine/threonine-protein kinase
MHPIVPVARGDEPMRPSRTADTTLAADPPPDALLAVDLPDVPADLPLCAGPTADKTLVSARSPTRDPPPPPVQREEEEEEPSLLEAGQVIGGRYRLLRLLGRGGMGEVWSAEHLDLNVEVAIKFLSRTLVGFSSGAARARFRLEAQVSAQLGVKTTHVIPVRDVGKEDAGSYLVMDYVPGRTLRSELCEHGPLPLEEVASLLDQVAEALTAAHEAGVIHRDLKPSNFLLVDRPDGSLDVKVADFGIAKATQGGRLLVDSPEETGPGLMLGSPIYMSPEQMDGRRVDTRTDLWALGVVVYEALTGGLPFSGRSVIEIAVRISAGRYDPPTVGGRTLPREVEAWFARALARDRTRRFPTAAIMARTFREAVEKQSRPRPPILAKGVTIGLGLLGVLALLCRVFAMYMTLGIYVALTIRVTIYAA